MKLPLSKFCVLATLSFLLVFYSFVTLSSAAPTWNVQVPDSQGIVGAYTSIALDICGNPHLSYQGYNNQNSTLKYASYNGNTWKIETADSQDITEGSYTSLALDSAGYPHISYINDHLSQLRYAHWTGSIWVAENVSAEGQAGSYTSLALDSQGNPSIAFHTGGQGLMGNLNYAHWTGNTWNIENVVPAGESRNAGQCCSLDLDSSNHPHISYYDTAGGLNYASWSGSAWVTEIVDIAGAVGSCLALDSAGYPHISYATISFSTPKYASWSGSAWKIESVDSASTNCQFTSLVLDSNGAPHIAFMNYQQDGSSILKYAQSTTAGWKVENVDLAAGNYASIAIDRGDNPQISYWDPMKQDLKYATFADRYNVGFSQSGLSNSAGTVLIVDSSSYKLGDLPVNFSWNSGTTHVFAYPSTVGTASGERYNWTGTAGLSTTQSGTLLVAGSGSVSGAYQLQAQTSDNVQAKTDNGTTIELAISGNVTATQMSNIAFTSDQATVTTTLSFTLTGESGNSGMGNITIPKSSIAFGNAPAVNIDEQPASNQGYTQDSSNYYIWYKIHFSTHTVSIVFAGTAQSLSPSQTLTTVPTEQPNSPSEAVYALTAIVAIVAIIAVFLIARKKTK